ncbi:hypothetical protein M885DRAFT_556501 [Pelagophyceae sp. CCMP2097]|nr:hypothetical protein M885DRAFT_556501 [Pelagophyceae sp. CCMP2097]
MFRFLGLPEVDLTAARIAQVARRSAGDGAPECGPPLRKTRRFLDAFFAVDTQLLRKMAPGADVPGPWGK